MRAGQKDGRGFLLSSNSQFRPGPPPALDSAKFLDALAEIRAYGQNTSSVRTPAQTDTANFIYQDSYALYGQVLKAVLADTHHSLLWDARAVAAFHVITVDTQIAIFEAKYTTRSGARLRQSVPAASTPTQPGRRCGRRPAIPSTRAGTPATRERLRAC